MAISDNKSRVMVTFNNELLGKLDDYCERIGISRSAFISYTVATALETQSQLVAGVTSGLVGAAVQELGGPK